MLSCSRKYAAQKGFTLVELMIGLSILALLVLLALPSYRTWIQGTQIRTATESIQNGLQLAKAEAVRRNANVQFLLTDTDPVATNVGSAVPSVDGRNWIVRIHQPDGNYSAADFVQGRARSEGSSNVLIAASQSSIIFLPLGRVSPGVDSDVTVENPAGGSCVAAGGEMRCLQVRISAGGRTRMCDPALSLATNPQGCA